MICQFIRLYVKKNKKWRNLLEGCLACILFLAMSGSMTFAQADLCRAYSKIASVRQDHIAKLNSLRLRQSVASVTRSAILDEVAQRYACLLAASGHFSHTGPNGSSLTERIQIGGYQLCQAGENLAKGYRSLDQALIGWVKSNGHWKNLKNADFRDVGLGVAYAKKNIRAGETSSISEFAEGLTGNPAPATGFPDHSTLIWVQVFASPC